MDIWIIALLVVVVAMAFGPIFMLQPNALQRRQAHLRTRASQLGLQVYILAPPAQATDTREPEFMPAYCLPIPHPGSIGNWVLRRTAYEHESHFLGFWSWQGAPASPAEQRVLEHCLPQLPTSVVAVSAGRRGWCFFWEEREGDAVLDQLDTALKALAGTTRSR